MATDFRERLTAFRKVRGQTRRELADAIGVHVTQLRRHEAGTSQPTLDVLRKLAVALRVSADALLFGEDTREPDEELRLQFEAITQLDPEEKAFVQSVLEGLLLKHDARHWIKAGAGA